MKFIDLHTDLINYFLRKERGFLSMRQSNFSTMSLDRHADIPGYKSVGTKILVCSLFPLSITKDGIVAKNPKKEIERQLKAYQKLLETYPIFSLVRDRKDLSRVMADDNKIGIILNMEGGEAVCSTADLEKFFSKGLRSFGMTWMLDNQLAGGDKGTQGLTATGKMVVKKLQDLSILIDLVHSSRKTFKDTLRIANGPIMVSHCGIGPIVKHKQNPTEAQIRAVIKRNGIIGLSFLSGFYGKKQATLQDVVRHLNFFKEKFGTRNISIGSDYFGYGLTDGVAELNHVSRLPVLAKALKKEGWNKNEIENLLWKNAYRLLQTTLPHST